MRITLNSFTSQRFAQLESVFICQPSSLRSPNYFEMRPIDENSCMSTEHTCKERHPYAVAISELDYQQLLTFLYSSQFLKWKFWITFPSIKIRYSIIRRTVLVQLLRVNSRFITSAEYSIFIPCLWNYGFGSQYQSPWRTSPSKCNTKLMGYVWNVCSRWFITTERILQITLFGWLSLSQKAQDTKGVLCSNHVIIWWRDRSLPSTGSVNSPDSANIPRGWPQKQSYLVQPLWRN